MQSDWRDSEDFPPVTRSVARWYRYRVILFCRTAKQASPEATDYLVDWYCDRPERFLAYEPFETYQGPHYSMGSWVVRHEAMQSALVEASRAVLGIVLADTSGPITEASVDAALTRTDAPPEPHAFTLLGYESPYVEARHRIEADWPRLCVSCGAEFRPHHVGRVRCPDCLARGKQQGNRRGAK